MSVGTGICALLSAQNGGDAIDTYVAGRIFNDVAPPDFAQLPCITYSFVGGSASPTLSTSGVVRHRVELDAFAVQPDAANSLQPGDIAEAVKDAIIARLNGWQQLLSDGTNVLNAVLLNPGTCFVTEQRVFRNMCEFYVLYTLPS